MTNVIKIINHNIKLDELKKIADEFDVEPVITVVDYLSYETVSETIYHVIMYFLLEFKTEEDAIQFKLKYKGLCEELVQNK